MIAIDLFRHDENALAFSDGQTIFAEGDPGEVMFVVSEGAVDLSVRGKLVETLEPGGMFGEMALLDTEPRIATAVARGACRVSPIDKRRFLFLVEQTPHFALHIMQVMAERLRRMDNLL